MPQEYKGIFGHRQHIAGLGAAIKKFNDIMNAYGAKGDGLADVFYKGAKKIRNSARNNIRHEKSGNLRRGIVAKKFKPGISEKPGAFCGINYKISPHAHLVEYGHVASGWYEGGGHVPAYPFFRPAIDMNAASIMIDIKKEMWTKMLRAARS